MHNLPLQLTSFIGREQELAEIGRLTQEAQLLTLTGPGGCGKTRLAMQAASALQGHFSDGVWWVELASIAEPAVVPQMLLIALAPLGVREQPDRTPLQDLIAHLHARELLLLLDNCEHLTVVCAHLAETLLRACPSLHILATSRERLGVSGERVWLVPSLTAPPPAALGSRLLPVDELAQYEAVRLFVERAEVARRTFRLNEQNAPAVARICQRLDGIPLAIELAAARVAMLSVEQIAVRLDNSFRLLGASGHTLLPRQRTLRASVDWSHDLLSEPEQRLFRRLAVFTAGCSLEAVEMICADGPEQAFDNHGEEVLDLLARLVDKSLVTIQEQAGAARYALLEIFRQYGREQLKQRDEETRLRTRHLDWYLAFAEQADASTLEAERADWMARLACEHANLRAALEWSLGANADPALAGQGVRLANAMAVFWYERGYLNEGRLWLDRALARSTNSPASIRAQTLVRAGFLAWGQNDYGQASALLAEGHALARSLGSAGRPALQMALNLLGAVAYYQDNYPQATTLFEAWLGLLRAQGDRSFIPFALSWLGRVAVRQGAYARASALGEESLAISRQLGSMHSIAAALNLLGTVACYQGAFDQATARLEESLSLSRQLSHQQDVADTLVVLAIAALHQGDPGRAAAALDESLAISREVGYRQGVALALGRLGEVACAQGEYVRAEALLKESLVLFNALDARWFMLHGLETAAGVAIAPGRARQAALLLAAVAALRTGLGAARPPIDQPVCERTLAAARSSLGEAAFATAWAEGAIMDLTQAVACALGGERSTGVELAQGEPLLRICALGMVEIYCAGRLLTNADWTYAKPRELFFYLLCHPPRKREQIGLVLWPDASPAQLRSRLHISLHRLRQALGRPDWVLFANGRYSFNHTLDTWFDVTLFESNLQQMQRASAAPANAPDTDTANAAMQRLEETLRLYRGDFLEEMEAHEWVCQRREMLRSRYLAGLLTLGQWRFVAGHYEAAAEVYRRAIAHDAYLERAHCELMRCLARLDSSSLALRHYQTLVALLREELGLSPAPETLALVEALRHGQRV